MGSSNNNFKHINFKILNNRFFKIITGNKIVFLNKMKITRTIKIKTNKKKKITKMKSMVKLITIIMINTIILMIKMGIMQGKMDAYNIIKKMMMIMMMMRGNTRTKNIMRKMTINQTKKKMMENMIKMIKYTIKILNNKTILYPMVFHKNKLKCYHAINLQKLNHYKLHLLKNNS